VWGRGWFIAMHGIELHFVDHEYAYASGTINNVFTATTPVRGVSMLYFKPRTTVPHACNFINGPYCALVQAGGRAEAQPNRLRDATRVPPVRI
jgi:hypothetical protein